MSTHSSLAEIRYVNQRAALDACYALGDTFTLKDLVEATGLSRPTLTQSLRAMEQAGLVRSETTRPASGLGRPMAVFHPVAEQHRLLVVIIGYESCDVTMVDATGAVIATDHALMSPSPVHDIVAAVDRVVEEGDSPVLGGVIAVMGIVQGENSVRSNRYPWLGEPESLAAIKAPVLDRWPDADIVVRNDAKLAAGFLMSALAESGHPARSAVALHMTEAVGCGLVIAGEVLEGAHGAAGEIGLDPNGAFGSAEIALREGAQKLGITRLEVFREASRDNPRALKIAREIGRWLALGVRSTTLALDPEVVVLGGPVSACGEALRSVFVEALGDVSLTPPEVVLVASSGDAVHRGALLVASDRARTRLVEALPQA